MSAAELLGGAVQIAGVIDAEEAAMLIAAGADFLGFPLRLHDGREDLSESDARAIIASLPAHVTAVAITYLDRARDVIDLCETTGARWVQLHGVIALAELETLRVRRPDLAVIKSLIVRRGNEAELASEARHFAPYVDAFIIDTWDAATRRSGATGLVHDWRVSRALVERATRPVILAGGLDAANVAAAILAVRPAAVDAHSRIEAVDGRKDPQRAQSFVATARSAFSRLGVHRR